MEKRQNLEIEVLKIEQGNMRGQLDRIEKKVEEIASHGSAGMQTLQKSVAEMYATKSDTNIIHQQITSALVEIKEKINETKQYFVTTQDFLLLKTNIEDNFKSVAKEIEGIKLSAKPFTDTFWDIVKYVAVGIVVYAIAHGNIKL